MKHKLTAIDLILVGLTCVHRKMRYTSCGYCFKSCRVQCPDCGLIWMLHEGVNG